MNYPNSYVRLFASTPNVGMWNLGGVCRPLELEKLPISTTVTELEEAIDDWQEFLGEDYDIRYQIVGAGLDLLDF